jgi:hypothetical protein
MVTPRDNVDALAREFSRLGIPIESPGFYDHPRFIEQEKMQGDFLELYAAYVQKRHYEPDYLEYSRGVITKCAEILHRELVQDERLGACIDASMVLSRILENEGIWNYVAHGALTIEFPSRSRIPTLFFWPVDEGEFQAAHAWLIAPPFLLVDIVIKRQPYEHGISDYLPEIVLANEANPSRASDDDLFSPYAQAHFRAQGIPRSMLITRITPHLPQFWSVFPPRKFRNRDSSIKYTPIGISASDLPLEGITSLTLSGRTGIQIYYDLIKPSL